MGLKVGDRVQCHQADKAFNNAYGVISSFLFEGDRADALVKFDGVLKSHWIPQHQLHRVQPESKPMLLSSDPMQRKGMPITTGVLDYFPLALAEVAMCSKAGNDQHNPGQPLHWAKEKSTDHADCIVRHLIDRGAFDTDGIRHSAKLAWRALAQLQLELEAEQKDKQ